jgi:transposase-like protein
MSKNRYNEEQIKELLSNIYVARCSDKSITYTKEFKQLAIKQYELGMIATEIFRDANFNLELVGRDRRNDCLKRWRTTYKTRGLNRLNSETRGRSHRGGRPRIRGLTDADKINRLEIEVAYLKAENDFLVKLRAAKKR